MPQEDQPNIELPPLPFVSLQFHMEPKGLSWLVAVRSDGTVLKRVANTLEERRLLVQAAQKVGVAVDELNKYFGFS